MPRVSCDAHARDGGEPHLLLIPIQSDEAVLEVEVAKVLEVYAVVGDDEDTELVVGTLLELEVVD